MTKPLTENEFDNRLGICSVGAADEDKDKVLGACFDLQDHDMEMREVIRNIRQHIQDAEDGVISKKEAYQEVRWELIDHMRRMS